MILCLKTYDNQCSFSFYFDLNVQNFPFYKGGGKNYWNICWAGRRGGGGKHFFSAKKNEGVKTFFGEKNDGANALSDEKNDGAEEFFDRNHFLSFFVIDAFCQMLNAE